MGKRQQPRITFAIKIGLSGSAPFRVPPHWIVLAILLSLYLLTHGQVVLPAHGMAQI